MREQQPTDHHKDYNRRHKQTAVIPFIGQSIIRPSRPLYRKVLDESGYHYTLHYEPTATAKRRNRQRNNIFWYNPPFSKNVNTNIGHRFLTLVDKHFPKENKLRKIFNRNTINISYSCMNNTKQIIDNHNKRILNSSKHADKSTDNPVDNKSCNCRQKNTCPLNGSCLQSSVIFQPTVKRNDNSSSETYIGLTENAFKTRYRNHTASFRHTKHRNSTELSKHVWSLIDNNIDYSVSWRIISSSSSYNSLACSRLRDGGGKSFSNKKCEKRARAGERQGSGVCTHFFNGLFRYISSWYTLWLVNCGS